MSSALKRGRKLDPKAVEGARKWRENRIKMLTEKRNNGTATMKELRELRWNWGIK
jgi:hypothetical protein